MTTKLKKLSINRVDLVPEGANSAAFITLYKRKEGKPMEFEEILEKMKPEHAEVIKAKFAEIAKEADDAKEEAAEAKAEAEEAKKAKDPDQEDCKKADVCPECGKNPCVCEDNKMAKEASGTVSFDEDETLIKSLPEELQSFVAKMRQQKEAAEEVAKAAIAREKHAEAISKAAELKALPIESAELVAFIEKSNEETVDMLSAIAKAIESTVLIETGSNETGSFAKSANDAWDQLERKAADIAKERGISKAKGMSAAIDEYPELYREYLEGGAN